MPDKPDTALTLDQLATLVELPRRTVRYYIQQGLVDRPEGETRAARYSTHHLNQLLSIRQWQRAGLSLERIRELLQGEPAQVPVRARGAGTVEVWTHLVVADGIELTLEPGRAGLSPEQVRAFLRAVVETYSSIVETPDV